MKYIVKCGECGSTNLKKFKFILGKGTIGERDEDRFRCLDCGEGMDLYEVEFEIVEFIKAKDKKRCTACYGSGWYDNCDKHGDPIKCSACNGTGFETE